jgi:glutamine amidotransferase
MIGILDYGGGNLASVRNALERISIPSDSDLKNEEVFFVSDDPDNLQKAEKIIFPGQGRAGRRDGRPKEKGVG